MFLVLLLISYCFAFREISLKADFYSGFDNVLSNFQFHIFDKQNATLTIANFGIDNTNVDWLGPSSGFTYKIEFTNFNLIEDQDSLYVTNLFSINFKDQISFNYYRDDVYIELHMNDISGNVSLGNLNSDISIWAYQQLQMDTGYFFFKNIDYIKSSKGRMILQSTTYNEVVPAFTMQVGILQEYQNPSYPQSYTNYYIHGFVTKSDNDFFCPQPYNTEILNLLVSTNYQGKIMNYENKGTLVKTKCLNPEYNTTYINTSPLPPNTIWAQQFEFTFDNLLLVCDVVQPSGIGEPIVNLFENSAQYHMKCYSPNQVLYSWYREFI